MTPPIPRLLSNQGAALAQAATNQERRELRPEPAGALRAQSRERAVVARRPGGSSAEAAAGRRLGWGAGGGADLRADAGTLLTATPVSRPGPGSDLGAAGGRRGAPAARS